MIMPKNTGPYHIIGVGGIGMSAIADIMQTHGYAVQGSDQKDSANLRRLAKKGVRVFPYHDAVHLEGVKRVVISSAVKTGNPELDAARAAGLPIISRAEMLAELMRMHRTVAVTGSHGKTTTTAMISWIFEQSGADPTVIAGGIINGWGTNARVGAGEWMVVEADESDGTFIKLPTQIGVVTNIDPEHLDFYETLDGLHEAFEIFFANIPFYGVAVAGVDHPVVREIIERIGSVENGRRVITFGAAHDADVQLTTTRINGTLMGFDVRLGASVTGGERDLNGLKLLVPGHYNILNALAAIAVATEAGVCDDAIRDALATFSGVKRRFTFVGDWNGVDIYDDYAHHPAEIAAVLKAARQGAKGRVIAIAQPHRYSRLKGLFEDFSACFADADIVILSPVYSAGEKPNGVDHVTLAESVRRTGHMDVRTIESDAEIPGLIAALTRPGDMVLGLGAGTITDWINALPSILQASTQNAAAAE
ncbi:MAG: UDP-N-acetylmuramate--L-alanine ligase [Hyphomicrobiales bacterium]|nr:UDP-N-acetylmuramate--L-alanine ligase [Hyphomicrobiales bacterium]